MSLNLLYQKKIILEAKNPRHAVITDQLVRGRASEICSQFGKITESWEKHIIVILALTIKERVNSLHRKEKKWNYLTKIGHFLQNCQLFLVHT